MPNPGGRGASLCAMLTLALSCALSGCCVGGPKLLTLRMNTAVPRWNEVMIAPPEPVFEASFAEGDWPRGPVFELYDALDEAIELVETRIPWDDNPDKENSCSHSALTVTVTAPLAPGDYLLVHRRANGNGDEPQCNGACPWTEFDGEEALILTLRVLEP
jgi:hypothetical protein